MTSISAHRVVGRVRVQFALACVATLLAGCGGGSDTAPAIVVPADTFQAPVLAGNGSGLLTGEDVGTPTGITGTLIATGAAGQGELVQIEVRFPAVSAAAGTLTWKVLRSSYGILGQTGDLAIARDPRIASGEDGGYQVVGGVAGQPTNLFVARSGQISGSLPLTIGGRAQPTLFSGTRLRDALPRVADFAGTFAYGTLDAVAGSGARPNASYGTLRLNAGGSGRICDRQPYADACPGGRNVTAAMDPDHLGVMRITTTDNAIVIYAVGRRTAAGRLSLVMDVVGPPDPTQPALLRTGAAFAGSIDDKPFTPAEFQGAWSFVVQELGDTDFAFGGKASVVGEGRAVALVDTAAGCGSVQSYSFNGGGFTGGVGRTQLGQPVIVLDEDLVLSVDPPDLPRTPGSLTLLRRYSKDNSKAPCLVD